MTKTQLLQSLGKLLLLAKYTILNNISGR